MSVQGRLAATADAIDRVIAAIGRAVAWLVLVVVLIQFAVVVLRYAFGVVALVVLWFVPGLATWLPHKLYGGSQHPLRHSGTARRVGPGIHSHRP